MAKFSSTRVFINKRFHLFTFTQEKDGSIYISWPDFENTRWFLIKESQAEIVAIEATSPGEGKFTVHGSGQAGFREHTGRYDKTILFHGNQLVNSDQNSFGIRHLFTIQLPEPSFIPPNSPYLNRKTDYSILASHVVPSILIFFAIPKQNFDFEASFSLHEDFIPWSEDNQPTHYLGTHLFELSTHVVLWIAYRTTNMFWPAHPVVHYNNGYKIPFIIGKGNKEYTAELRAPEYELSGNKISINF
ncbi:hypothetical protein [Limnovirga soli]|uniref:Uncharacterized protein n=1 Tax=Limnovirga soli TaxID=2656915 RepID=A0A8J8JV56_9BACT|nr:hypothetical protein [Limnovirga soli]NNV53871.1 hypothetical protein [Limnovirga soli]